MPDVAHVRGIVARRDIGVGRREDHETAPVHLRRECAVADSFNASVRSVGHRLPNLSCGVVVVNGRHYLALARTHVGCRRAQLDAGVVKVGRHGLVRGGHRILPDQPAARIKRIRNSTAEDSHGETVEEDLHTVTDGASLRTQSLERAFKPASALRIASGEIEEFVKAGSSPPLSRAGPILGPRISHHDPILQRDPCDQRLCGIKREFSGPRLRRLIRPADGQRVARDGHGDGPRTHLRYVRGYRRGADLKAKKEEDEKHHG